MIAAVGNVMLSCENVVIYGKVAQSSSEVKKLFSFYNFVKMFLQLQAFSIQLQQHFPTLSAIFFDFDWKLIFAVSAHRFSELLFGRNRSIEKLAEIEMFRKNLLLLLFRSFMQQPAPIWLFCCSSTFQLRKLT